MHARNTRSHRGRGRTKKDLDFYTCPIGPDIKEAKRGKRRGGINKDFLKGNGGSGSVKLQVIIN